MWSRCHTGIPSGRSAKPVSSNVSRDAASCRVSPGSTPPPTGYQHSACDFESLAWMRSRRLFASSNRSFTASLATVGSLERGCGRRGDPALVRGWVDVAAADDGAYVAVGEARGVFEDCGDAQGG